MQERKDTIGRDPLPWLERLREINKSSLFTASERALIEQRLATLCGELRRPIPFVEDRA